jgi:hypothetical protein
MILLLFRPRSRSRAARVEDVGSTSDLLASVPVVRQLPTVRHGGLRASETRRSWARMDEARKTAGLTFRKGDLVLVAIEGEIEDAAEAAPRPKGSGPTLVKTSGGGSVICEPGWGVAKVLAADDNDLGVHYLGYAAAERGPNCPYDAYRLLFTGADRVPWTGTVSKSAVECIIDDESWNASGDFARGRTLKSDFLKWLSSERPELYKYIDKAQQQQLLTGSVDGHGGSSSQRRSGGSGGSSGTKRTAPSSSGDDEEDVAVPSACSRPRRHAGLPSRLRDGHVHPSSDDDAAPEQCGRPPAKKGGRKSGGRGKGRRRAETSESDGDE